MPASKIEKRRRASSFPVNLVGEVGVAEEIASLTNFEAAGEMVAGTGFEPVKAMPADLQSAPVDRLGILPRGHLARAGND